MAQVKETGKQSQAVYTAEEARAAQKSARMAAGSMMLAESVKQVAREREAIKKEQEAKEEESKDKEGREPKDTPALSRQSKWFGTEGRLLEQENIKWTLEMEQEAWEAFLNWLPLKDKLLSGQLEELSRLYMKLLEAILMHTAGDEQAAQKEMLDAVLAQKLNLLLDAELEELLKLLQENGESAAVNNIKADVYKQATGEKVSGKAAGEFLNRARTGMAGNSRFFVPENAGAKQRDTGVLYSRAGGRSVQVDRAFTTYKNSEEVQLNQRNLILSGRKDGNEGGAYAKNEVYTSRELTKANRFAGHINGSGNLFKSGEITAKNEEVTGLLAGITSIKGQIYAEMTGKDSAVKVPVKNALNQFIDYYLTQKGVYKVYYYTISAYEKTKDAQKAMEEGLAYAYKQFLEKKNQEAYRRQEAYLEQAGFFHASRKDMSMEEDLRRGLLLLEKNWRNFLRSIGEEERRELLVTMQKYSIWGQLLRPDRQGQKVKEKSREAKRERAMTWQMIALAAAGAVYIFYRLFFG